MAIETIITQLALIEATITGVKKAYDNTPETIEIYPAFINVIRDGEFEFAAQELGRSTHRIRAILMVRPRENLPIERIEPEARPFIKRMRDKIASKITLNGTATHVVFGSPSYQYGKVDFGGIDWAAIEFILEITEKEAVTVSA